MPVSVKLCDYARLLLIPLGKPSGAVVFCYSFDQGIEYRDRRESDREWNTIYRGAVSRFWFDHQPDGFDRTVPLIKGKALMDKVHDSTFNGYDLRILICPCNTVGLYRLEMQKSSKGVKQK